MLKTKKYLLLLLALYFIGGSVFAGGNNKTVQLKGKVVDNQGNPVIGAKIEVTDSNQIIYTDFEGEFAFQTNKSEKKQIKISYISYEEQNLVLNSKDLTNSDLLFQLYSK
jgi:hypothetical protein